MKRLIRADYNINFNEVDDNNSDYTWKINNFIHNMKDRPVLWRLYKQKTWNPSDIFYRVVDVPGKRIGTLVDGLKEMPLLKQKNAKVTMQPYEDGTWVVNIKWKEPESAIESATYTYGESNDYDWLVGLYWIEDGHKFEITEVDNQLALCKVKESWTSEDTWEDVDNTSTYQMLSDLNGYLYIANRNFPNFKLYPSSAFNCPKSYLNHEEEYEVDNEEVEYDTPSATRGDYSPSAPWNAPGMSMKDFV